jgi:hypothetical protein
MEIEPAISPICWVRQQTYRQMLKEVAKYWGIHHTTASHPPQTVNRKKCEMDVK